MTFYHFQTLLEFQFLGQFMGLVTFIVLRMFSDLAEAIMKILSRPGMIT